mmetsp:Transcript_125249/g.245542  ORF Transcript_125249/g.245542 Transcript_125249/m.245542 type:complete len:108 (-) Transcript_125249:194-517(-)
MSSFQLFFVIFAVIAAFISASDCNNYNNDCLSCIQYSNGGAFKCSFCPVDGVCHTVGSIFNKCKSDECVSLSSASSCKMKTAADCDNVKYGDIRIVAEKQGNLKGSQ